LCRGTTDYTIRHSDLIILSCTNI